MAINIYSRKQMYISQEKLENLLYLNWDVSVGADGVHASENSLSQYKRHVQGNI